ncbi:thiosulfate sulfurtransferase GlpE [Motiliproteus sp. MSK22-1]|uniref:thiosulfate sulfurtransferase GlpE n=1 Tax=Motiliproteus sp. MSK22-1 TaxID=1897630 RepID=UPI000976AA7A|nr:thiosulfate sulfurtransferase GlpE [Motiliproteus sp. MSK22-1]OMH32153.1 thiosulfate sulfurtransferase [Motiliproteus sp. MSK22-1]
MQNSQFQRIPPDAAKKLIDEGATLADIRDPDSYARNHIAGALHLTNINIQDFVEQNDPDQPLIVYCYHGNSSQPAAQFLYEKGFEQVYSLDGGFEAWQQQYPETLES